MVTTDESLKIRECLQEVLTVSGALAAGIGNWKTGECLFKEGLNKPDFPTSKIEIAVTHNSEVIRAKQRAAAALEFDDKIDDILISLTRQWHIMKLLKVEGYFLYIALDRSKASIASAGLKLKQANRELSKVLANYP